MKYNQENSVVSRLIETAEPFRAVNLAFQDETDLRVILTPSEVTRLHTIEM